jgi:hypothetical protein
MPFKSKAQMRKCFALQSAGKSGNWDCGEWVDATADIKSLPEKAAKHSEVIAAAAAPGLAKIAQRLFKPSENPRIKPEIENADAIAAAKDNVRGGLSPVQYRNKLTAQRKGVVSQNRKSVAAQ